MPIVLVIEDGSSKPDANAYVDVSEARLYAANRGQELPGEDDTIAAWIICATDYLETFACQYMGHKTDPLQALEWPRTDVYFGCEPTPPYPSDAIPQAIKSAQCQLVMAQDAGLILQPNTTPKDFIIREKVGPIETEYANPVSVGMTTTFTAVDALLAPLFGNCASNKFSIRTVRV